MLVSKGLLTLVSLYLFKQDFSIGLTFYLTVFIIDGNTDLIAEVRLAIAFCQISTKHLKK